MRMTADLAAGYRNVVFTEGNEGHEDVLAALAAFCKKLLPLLDFCTPIGFTQAIGGDDYQPPPYVGGYSAADHPGPCSNFGKFLQSQRR